MIIGVGAGILIETDRQSPRTFPRAAFGFLAFRAPCVHCRFSVSFSLRQKIALKDLSRYALWQWITFFVLFYIFFYDLQWYVYLGEFKTLPLVSMIASGDIPPHFPYDTTLSWMNIIYAILCCSVYARGGFLSWTSLSILKALGLSLSTVW
jgi:hypothetical protein